MEQIGPKEQPISTEDQRRLEEIEKLVTLIDPKNPNFEGISLGLEITLKTPDGFTNIDHHGENCTDESPSCIEQVMEKSLKELPEGKMATVSPDLDSVGAMAVILLKREGKKVDERLVKAIGLLDRKGPAYFYEKGQQDLGLENDEEFEKIKEILKACRYRLNIERLRLPEAVLFMMKILSGDYTEEEIKKYAQEYDKKLEEAKKESKVEVIIDGLLVFVESKHQMAFDIGYEKGKIVIAYNPEFEWKGTGTITPKYTIARRDSNVREIDMEGLLEELNKIAEEKGLQGRWGGRENIIGSPIGENPLLDPEEVKDIVKKYIKREVKKEEVKNE